MIIEAATHDRIYRAIQERYLAGHFQPHVRIEITGIANLLDCSVTPVREVLYRMVGERLIDTHPNGSFQLAIPDADALANLYGHAGQQLLSALHLASRAAVRTAIGPYRDWNFSDGGISIPVATSMVFETIARASGNEEDHASVRHLNLRLHYCRLAEAKLFGDLERELRTFVRNGTIDVKMNVRRRIIAYHRRRAAHATQLALLLRGDA